MQYTHILYYARVCSKTMHSLLCITSKKLPYTTLCYIALRFILPWNFCAWLYYAAASQPRVFVRLLVGNHTSRSTTPRKLGGRLYLYQTSINSAIRNAFTCRLFWSETLLGVNSLLARVSVRGYLSVSTR